VCRLGDHAAGGAVIRRIAIVGGVALALLGWVVAGALFFHFQPSSCGFATQRSAPSIPAESRSQSPRTAALLKIYRRAHDPKQTAELLRSGDYIDALRAADLAEKALRYEDPFALEHEKRAEERATDDAESNELDQLIANQN
jgi:hypothetical protein